MGREFDTYGRERRGPLRVLVRKPDRKRPPRRSRRRRKNNIKTGSNRMGLREPGIDAGCGLFRHCNETSGSVECWVFLE